MPYIERETILTRLREKIRNKLPVLGAGAGTGISAKCEEAGGADVIIIYNSGRFRMAGRGSLAGLLAYGNANAMVKEMGPEILSIVKDTPVLAGVNGTDPFLNTNAFLKDLKSMGFSGIQNFPTVGLIDGNFRQNLEETGMSYQLEVDLVRQAHELGLFTSPYIFSPEDAVAMTEAGADMIVCHMGLTTGGSIGAHTGLTLDDSVKLTNECAAAATAVRDDVIILVHGGPVSSAADAEYVLQRTPRVHGFYGASSMERLPTETAIEEGMRAFGKISLEPVEFSLSQQ